MTVELKRDELGPMAVLSSPSSPGDAHEIRRAGVRRLRLELREADMPFLRDLEGIEDALTLVPLEEKKARTSPGPRGLRIP
jgi:hypothetical protein